MDNRWFGLGDRCRYTANHLMEMKKTSNRYRISLKALFVLPVIVLVGLIWSTTQFKHRVGSSKIGFLTTLNGVYCASNADAQLREWLETGGFVPCDRPNHISPYVYENEKWYFGVHNDVEIYISTQSDDSQFGAHAHYTSEKWNFQYTTVEEAATDEIAQMLRGWWDKHWPTLRTKLN